MSTPQSMLGTLGEPCSVAECLCTLFRSGCDGEWRRLAFEWAEFYFTISASISMRRVACTVSTRRPRLVGLSPTYFSLYRCLALSLSLYLSFLSIFAYFSPVWVPSFILPSVVQFRMWLSFHILFCSHSESSPPVLSQCIASYAGNVERSADSSTASALHYTFTTSAWLHTHSSLVMENPGSL